MAKSKELNISSIFIEINKSENKEENLSNFYYNDKENGFIKNKLVKETFEEYILNFITRSNNYNLNIINLYVINGDLEQNENNIRQSYSKYPLKKILNFEPVIKHEGIIQKILFFVQDLNQAQLLYFLYKQNIQNEPFEKVILLNYTKDCGYQTALFNNGETILNPIEFCGINKNKNLEENIDIILKGINTINEEEKKINILLTKSFDEKEENINPENIEEILNKKLENKNNIEINKLDMDFNKELEMNSHVFYLDN